MNTAVRGRSSGTLRVAIFQRADGSAGSLCEFLRQSGYAARFCHDADGMLDCVVKQAPHLVFLDDGLGAYRAYDLACRIKSLPGAQRRIVIRLNDSGDGINDLLAHEAGIALQLQKPLAIEELAGILSEVEKMLGDGARPTQSLDSS